MSTLFSSIWPINRTLSGATTPCEAGLAGRITDKKPLLRKQNNVKGVHWAKVHKHWTIKSKFETFGSNRRVYVQWRVGERAPTPCIIPTIKHRRDSVIISYLPTPPLGQDMTQGQFFKRSLTGLNSEFSFS